MDTVGRNKKIIEEYIKNQQKEDMISGQISIKEYMDHIKSRKVLNCFLFEFKVFSTITVKNSIPRNTIE